MKKLFFILMITFLAACQIQEQKTFTLNGEIEGKETGYVYLVDRVHGLYQMVDSAAVTDGRFSFTGSLEFPALYYLEISRGNNSRIAFFMENTEMDLRLNAEDISGFSLSGSPSQHILQEFELLMAESDAILKGLQQEILAAEIHEDAELVDNLRTEYRDRELLKKKLIREFVDQHLDKTVGLFIAMRYLSYDMDGDELDRLLRSFSPSIEKSRYYVGMRDRADKLMALSNGKVAPDFTLDDINGVPVALSDFRGKYLLISFWASWCPYCRAENPHLVQVYERYKDEGFEILGVSLDRSREPWLQAIADDGLNWSHVSDLKGWENEASTLYGVASIPSTVLLDPNGVVLGRNLKGEALDKMMDELFGPEV